MSRKEPWFKFYPADWRADPRLRMCSIGARGLWAEMLCVMHEADPYGYLLSNGNVVNSRQMAGLAGIPVAECMRYTLELASAGVYSIDESRRIFSRRMVRDKAKAENDRANGKGGGNPKLRGAVKEGVNPPDKAQKPEAIFQIQKETEANASGADAPRDVRAELFGRGLQTLARLTGKGPDSCRSFVGKCLKAASDDAVTVLGLIEDAERNRVVDPSAWIVAGLKATGPPALRPLTEFQRGRNETKEILNDLGNYATGGGGGEENSRLLRGDTGERPEGIRGGIGADVIDLPAIGHRSSG